MLAQQYGRLPILPQRILRQYQVYEPADTRFRAAARLQQALWRQKNGWKPGYQKSPNGRRRKIGSRIGNAAAQAGANFISADIAKLARREIAFREDGALIDEVRLTTNLLSSAPVVFNTFGALKLDLKLATRVFRRLFPDYVRRITGILIEHAPDRGNPVYTADYSALDLLVQCRTINGESGCIGIEAKFSEGFTEPPPRMRRPRYDELARSSGLFKDPDSAALRENPLQQFFRQHLLLQAVLDQKLYAIGKFVVIAPRFNSQAQRAIRIYRKHLADTGGKLTFDDVTLERVIDAIKQSGAFEISQLLYQRYCDYGPLDALI